jgi:hypothetical protein
VKVEGQEIYSAYKIARINMSDNSSVKKAIASIKKAAENNRKELKLIDPL